MIYDIYKSYPLTTRTQRREITPFFIIGSGRSGTTLLRSVLQRHDDIDIPPESHGSIPNSVKKFYRYGGLDWQDLVSVVLGEFTSDPYFKVWELDLSATQMRALELPEEDRSLAKIIDLIYRGHIETHKPEASIWGDKTPFNTLRLDWIQKVFPEGKYIHMIRDGRDVVSSMLKSGRYDKINDACRRWNLALDSVVQFEQEAANSVLSIYYEKFVRDTEMAVRDVCGFLGIEYSDGMLSNSDVYLGDDHLEHLQNVNKPITDKSVGKWKERLSEEQKRIAIKLMKQNLVKHNYM